LLPAFGGDACFRPGEFGKDGNESQEPTWGELDGTGNGIDDPAQHSLGCFPGAIALEELFDGDGLLAGAGVAVGKRTEDGINGFKEHAMDAILTALSSLHEAQEIIHVNVDILKGLLAGVARKIRGIG
jgi:hypothetical protein